MTKKQAILFFYFLLLDQKKQKSRTNANSNSFIHFFLVRTIGIHECFAILTQNLRNTTEKIVVHTVRSHLPHNYQCMH